MNGAYYQANGINIIGHNGLDLKAYHGQPVFASHDGTAFYETDDRQGHGVVIITDSMFDYNGGQSFYKTIYWHFAEPSATYPQLVTNGQHVTRGQQIGWADNTGFSGGDHLHYGLKPVIKAGTSPEYWANQEQNNGYQGAVNPLPFMDGISIFTRDLFFGSTGEDVKQLQKWLNIHGWAVTPTGQETSFYGPKTVAAVAGLQKSVGISPAAGYFGPKTRTFVNNS